MQEKPWLPSDKPQGQIKIEDQVRPWVEGMTTLVISNRADPELESKLTDKLGLDITWAICDIRRAQAQAKAIRGKKYDLVIGQTGFMGHGIESIIAQAAKDVEVPYIRADKARPTSTALALIRDLGLDISKEPPNPVKIRAQAPPEERSNGRIRRRRVVTVPVDPKDYKELDIEVLRFLDAQNSYFRMGDVLRSIKGIPLVLTAEGKINFSKMHGWTVAIARILKDLNYVNTQLPTAIDPNRPRVWIRRDRQHLLNPQNTRAKKRAETERFQAGIERFSEAVVEKSHRPRTLGNSGEWMQKHGKIVRAFVKDKLYVHPEDILIAIGLDLPDGQLVMQDYMYWTKRAAKVLRKMGFTPRSRNVSGTSRRVWIHKKAPPGMVIHPPGEYPDFEKYKEKPVAKASSVDFPEAASIMSTSEPGRAPGSTVAQPSAGPKSVRVSYSSIEGGDMQEILLLLTQAGWNVSFGP